MTSHPVLSCSAALQLEQRLLPDDGHAWQAMERAGRGVARAALRDLRELGDLRDALRVLVLAGPGHNGGDALLAAYEIVCRMPKARVDVLRLLPEPAMKPLALRALGLLKAYQAVTVHEVPARSADALSEWLHALAPEGAWDLCLDGLYGMQFRPPLREHAAHLVEAVNAAPNLGLRAAVDLPSGVGEVAVPLAFRADFSYATGIAKGPLFAPENAEYVGRVRYVDIGFFDVPDAPELQPEAPKLLLPGVLDPLRALRPSHCDKRTFGHLFILGGSRRMPGALLMAVKAALRSGVGLVTAFAPESVTASFAAAAPEAMWVPWPETPEGGLALEGLGEFLRLIGSATAVLVGPGLGREPETLTLARELVRECTLPLVLDADALQKSVFDALRGRSSSAGPVLATPHAGEFSRIGGTDTAPEGLNAFAREHRCVVALKGPVTRVSHGGQCWLSPFGGPVLARGGSGDILSGLAGGLLAQVPTEPAQALCRAVVWHGLAADVLARRQGHASAVATDLLPCLPAVLRADF